MVVNVVTQTQRCSSALLFSSFAFYASHQSGAVLRADSQMTLWAVASYFSIFWVKAIVASFTLRSRGLLLLHRVWIVEGQATPLHCLFDWFLERWCSLAPYHERHHKLFREIFDEQSPHMGHARHVIRLQCFEYCKSIQGGDVQHVMPENCWPPPCHPFARIISYHLIYSNHASFSLVVIKNDLWFFLFTAIHRFVAVHWTYEDNRFCRFGAVAYHGQVVVESELWAMYFSRLGWLHDSWYVSFAFTESSHDS